MELYHCCHLLSVVFLATQPVRSWAGARCQGGTRALAPWEILDCGLPAAKLNRREKPTVGREPHERSARGTRATARVANGKQVPPMDAPKLRSTTARPKAKLRSLCRQALRVAKPRQTRRSLLM